MIGLMYYKGYGLPVDYTEGVTRWLPSDSCIAFSVFVLSFPYQDERGGGSRGR